MSIKICVLSDGVRVIGDFYEVTSTFKKVVGYAIVHPQIISMTRTVPSSMVTQTNEPQFNVQFSPWNPFAKNQFFRLNMDRVVSVSDPREDILQIYKEQFYVENYLDDLIPDEPLERIIYDDSSR